MFKYKEFLFTGYKFNKKTGELSLRYSLDNEVNFEEKVFFDVSKVDFNLIDKNLLENAFFNLHLIAGISYYKTYCPPRLVVETGRLSKAQIKFWEKLYTFGLGEFFYKNQIDFRELVNLESAESANFKVQTENNKLILASSEARKSPESKPHFEESDELNNIPHLASPKRGGINSRCLVPIGGGKDSLVTAELLKKGGFDFTFYSLDESVPQRETAKIAGKDYFSVKRKLAPKLFELNEQGAYNGHIPISAYFAFLSLATSILYGYDYIVLSNEHSANYGNLDYLGMNINHQYSKSLEFEQDFNDYVHHHITTEIQYFSLLRPYYELKIAKIFSHYPQYFSKFTSCNANFKIIEQKISTKWCCSCPKCAFVYTILAPFISREKMMEVFGKNLFEEEKLKDLFLELLGVQDNKPFECVGTAEEVAVAFYLVSEKNEWKDDLMVRIFKAKVLPQIENIEELKKKVMGTYLEESLVPEEFREILD